MVGVILAAGNGTRLKDSTGEDCCKALKRINDKYLIEYALSNVAELGIDEVCIVIGQEGDLIREAIGNEYKNVKVTYAYQQQQKGLIDALVQGVNSINDNEDILLQLSDEIMIDLRKSEIKSVISGMQSSFYCGITYEENPKKIMNNFSVDVDENMNINCCTEKPTQVINNIKGTGFCIFTNDAICKLKEMYDDGNGELFDLCDYMNSLISIEKKGVALLVADKEFNINTSYDLEEALIFMNESK